MAIVAACNHEQELKDVKLTEGHHQMDNGRNRRDAPQKLCMEKGMPLQHLKHKHLPTYERTFNYIIDPKIAII